MATNFYGYCSVDDLKDEIVNLDFGTNSKLTDPRITAHILSAYSEINAAAAKGGYTVPVTNSVKQDVTGAITATTTTQDDIVVSDGSLFAGGNWIRVHGEASNIDQDEFVPIVSVSSNTLTVAFTRNSYDDSPDPTVELCTEGYLFLRQTNIKGAAYRALRSLIVGAGRSTNELITEFRDQYNMCLEELRKGEVNLEGLATGNSIAISFQTENPDDASVAPVITRERIF